MSANVLQKKLCYKLTCQDESVSVLHHHQQKMVVLNIHNKRTLAAFTGQQIPLHSSERLVMTADKV